MDKETSDKELLTYVNQTHSDYRGFTKYLITVAMAIIPIIIGVAGFLLKDQELTSWGMYLLIIGLILIFMTIPINIITYSAILKALDIETMKKVWEIAMLMRKVTRILALILSLGALLAFSSLFMLI